MVLITLIWLANRSWPGASARRIGGGRENLSVIASVCCPTRPWMDCTPLVFLRNHIESFLEEDGGQGWDVFPFHVPFTLSSRLQVRLLIVTTYDGSRGNRVVSALILEISGQSTHQTECGNCLFVIIFYTVLQAIDIQLQHPVCYYVSATTRSAQAPIDSEEACVLFLSRSVGLRARQNYLPLKCVTF